MLKKEYICARMEDMGAINQFGSSDYVIGAVQPQTRGWGAACSFLAFALSRTRNLLETRLLNGQPSSIVVSDRRPALCLMFMLHLKPVI